MVNAPVATTELYEHAMLKYEASGRESIPVVVSLHEEDFKAKVGSSVRILPDLYVQFLCLAIRSQKEEI